MTQKSFNPHDHLIHLKSREGTKDYLPVQWRLVWFREMCPHGKIRTKLEMIDLDREEEAEGFAWNNETRRSEKITKRAKGFALFSAIVEDGEGGEATGHKSERAVSFPDYIEKAETGAIGRALAGLGYGTQFTDEEFDEGERLADAPVERRPAPPTTTAQEPAAAQAGNDAPATDQQLAAIVKLASKLGKEVEEPRSYSEAKELISQLNEEHKKSRNSSGK